MGIIIPLQKFRLKDGGGLRFEMGVLSGIYGTCIAGCVHAVCEAKQYIYIIGMQSLFACGCYKYSGISLTQTLRGPQEKLN